MSVQTMAEVPATKWEPLEYTDSYAVAEMDVYIV